MAKPAIVKSETASTETKTNPVKELTLAGDAIAKDIKGMSARIQAHLVNLVMFALDPKHSGNVEPLSRFMRQVANIDKDGNAKSVIRATAIRAYLEKHAFVTWNTDKNTFRVSKRRPADDVLSSDTFRKEHKAAATKAKWNEAGKGETGWTPFNLLAALESLAKRADEKRGETVPAGKEAHKVPMELLSKINEMVSNYKSATTTVQ